MSDESLDGLAICFMVVAVYILSRCCSSSVDHSAPSPQVYYNEATYQQRQRPYEWDDYNARQQNIAQQQRIARLQQIEWDRQLEITRANEVRRRQDLYQYESSLYQRLPPPQREREVEEAPTASSSPVQYFGSFFNDDEPIVNDIDRPERATYESLRSQARAQTQLMRDSYALSDNARATNQLALARSYSAQGKSFESERNRLNEEASSWIYEKHNAGLAPNVIDLHGQFVSEAIKRTDEAISAAVARGDRTMRIIVGKGSHSVGLESKLRPAVEAHLRKQMHTVEIDPLNSGSLNVSLSATDDEYWG